MRLTFHGTLLGVILVLLAMMAIGPARQLYQEHQAIRADESSLAAGTAERAAMTARLAQLQDPAYVEDLARQELGYVAPGETSYIVPGSSQTLSLPTAPASAPAPQPWWARLWHDLT